MITSLATPLLNSVSTSTARPPVENGVAGSFSDALNALASSGLNNVQLAENSAITGLLGSGSINDVVHNVMAAERSLHTIIAIRDKAVGAYQEIARMQI